MIRDPLFILAVLAGLVALSEWLGRATWLRHLGSALVVIVLTAVAANLGLVPTYSDEIAVYSGIFAHVAPLAIFLLVLQVDLRSVLKAGLPMIGLFLLGALGTVLGVVVGLWAVGGQEAFGEFYAPLGGMFVATYIGGSVNYNAVALHYDVVKQGALYAGAAAVDSAMTVLWMVVTVAAPRWLPGFVRVPGTATSTTASTDGGANVRVPGTVTSAETGANVGVPGTVTSAETGADVGVPGTVTTTVTDTAEATSADRETVDTFDLGLMMALGGVAVWLSNLLGGWTGIPSILVLTTFALVLAQVPAIQRCRGARLGGWLAVMLFLAVIGTLCDLEALASIGRLGTDLLIFVSLLLAVHGAVIFGGGWLLKIDPIVAAVASQANIGGSTSALAVARSLGREDQVLPGVLVGALGNALGTYLGFLAVGLLG